MEKDKNPFPQIDLFPRITRVAKFVGGLFTMHQLASHGDHFQNTGGGPALDRALYDDEPLRLFYDQPEVGIGFTHTPTRVERADGTPL